MRDLFTFISELKLSPEVRDFRPDNRGNEGGRATLVAEEVCKCALVNSLTKLIDCAPFRSRL